MEAPRLGRKDRSQFWPKRQFPAAKAPTPARPAPAPRFASPWLLFALTAGMKGPKPPNTCCLWGLGMATTVALITRRVGGTKRKYSMAEGEGLCGRREGGSPEDEGGYYRALLHRTSV